ncbi:MAG TPA: hypothetical protein VJU82_04370, partial [Acidobacteriaceae bacterium]|nr:hypothetical protein [Acidobacteriaceae bacterium]
AYYLAGVAYGSLAVRDACAKRLSHDTQQTLWSTAKVVLLGTVCAYLTGPLLARSVTLVPVTFTVVLVFMSAALLGSALPLLAHASIEPDQPAGTGISYLYLSNIVGSTLGSFLVGFVILDHWSTQRTCALLLVVGACAFLALAGLAKPARSRLTVAAGCIVCAALAVSSKPLYSHMYERLLTKQGYERGFEFGDLVENRSGIVAVTKDSTVFGGGMYDGRFNIDPMDDRNGIFRAYAVANLKPNATEVLLIGLSSGSWAQVLVNNPSVRHMTIVEINPGYMALIEKHAEVRSLLRNPKVEIVTDDGRRWLTAHRGRMFDLIVMNTTFHWRANVSNLLSIEFLQMLRQHMKPGGVAFYNTTDGERVLATGIAAFPYAMRVSNFLAVSDRPFALNKHGFQKTLTEYEIDGRHVFDQSREKDRSKLSELVAIFDQPDSANGVYESRSAMLTRLSGVRAITDDNMGSEWDLDSH